MSENAKTNIPHFYIVLCVYKKNLFIHLSSGFFFSLVFLGESIAQDISEKCCASHISFNMNYELYCFMRMCIYENKSASHDASGRVLRCDQNTYQELKPTEATPG